MMSTLRWHNYKSRIREMPISLSKKIICHLICFHVYVTNIIWSFLTLTLKNDIRNRPCNSRLILHTINKVRRITLYFTNKGENSKTRRPCKRAHVCYCPAHKRMNKHKEPIQRVPNHPSTCTKLIHAGHCHRKGNTTNFLLTC